MRSFSASGVPPSSRVQHLATLGREGLGQGVDIATLPASTPSKLMKSPALGGAVAHLPSLVTVDGTVVLLQRSAEVAGAIATRYKIQRTRGLRLHRRQQRRLANMAMGVGGRPARV